MPRGDTLSGRYIWILVTGAFGAFGFGWGTGSNDVANAFGTSVGAKTLTLKQAVILAVIFEFTGAIVLGRVSAETISGGIARQDTFKDNAPAFAYGMSIVLWLGFLWQAYASYMGWNVSATHSIIGGIIGFAMAWGGADSVFWAVPDSTKIPPVKGVVPIILSWFISPILTAAASAIIYGTNVLLVLRSEHSLSRSYYVLPLLVFATVMIDIYFVFTKGAKKSFSAEDDWTDAKAAWISAVIAVGCSVLSGIFGIPYLRYKMRIKQSADRAIADDAALKSSTSDAARANLELLVVNGNGSMVPPTQPTVVHPSMYHAGQSNQFQPHPNFYPAYGSQFGAQYMTSGVGFGSMTDSSSDKRSSFSTPLYKPPAQPSEISNKAPMVNSSHMDPPTKLAQVEGPKSANAKMQGMMETSTKYLMRGLDYDVHKVVEEDPIVAAIHANAKKWDPDTEYVYGFLQVVSAICVIFAHGAGEVGYMAGPLAVIENVVMNPANNVVTNNTKVVPEIWVILIGAFGLVVGLATYGYKVCGAVGTQMARITPSRGFAAELATSFVIMIAAQWGLPTSSSQCITGGILGIAMFEGAKGVNYKLLLQTMGSWIMTMIVMGFGSALIFSQGVYAPNRFVSLRYNKNMTMGFDSLCGAYYNCKKGQYLKGCGFKDGDDKTYYAGSCTDCIVESSKCKSYQYLKGCGILEGGSCTNCTVTTKCTEGKKLMNCTGTSAGFCA